MMLCFIMVVRSFTQIVLISTVFNNYAYFFEGGRLVDGKRPFVFRLGEIIIPKLIEAVFGIMLRCIAVIALSQLMNCIMIPKVYCACCGTK